MSIASSATTYSTPAFIQDFPTNSAAQELLDVQWSTRAESWIQQAILGDPWNATYQSNQIWFYDPSQTTIPQGTACAQVVWSAFPNRITFYMTSESDGPYNFSQTDLLSFADTGCDTKGQSLQPIPVNRCPMPDWSGELAPYGPYGPRGWQDEYCEWSVVRSNNKVQRIDFVCENPEYWYTLWNVSPERVVELYNQTLNYDVPANMQIKVTLDDLTLKDPKTGKLAIDPSTGAPAYNPLNKWNAGPAAQRGANAIGGAMHLTSTPNTLQTELGLAGGATTQRTVGNDDPQTLICCAQYGQNFRHSDPHIGQSVNQVVGALNARVCLANPIGLYLQVPDFTRWSLSPNAKFPSGANASDAYTIVRGSASLVDPVTGKPFPGQGTTPGAFILHAVCQIPSSWLAFNPDLTLQDILIDGAPIVWAGQIAQTFNVGLYARPLVQQTQPETQPCVGTLANWTVQPLQFFYENLWNAYYNTPESSVVGQPLPLASNTVIVPPLIAQGVHDAQFVLTCVTNGAAQPQPLAPGAKVEFSTVDGTGVDSTIVATVVAQSAVQYAVPGNTYPSPSLAVTLSVDVAPGAAAGVRGIRVTQNGASGAFMPGLLEVLAVA